MSVPTSGRALLAVVLIGALLVTGCEAAPGASGAGASRQTPAEVAATLASLRRLDDLPLYELTYVGAYEPLAPPIPVTEPSPFGCSLFVAFGDPGRPLFARNFDWETHPALVVHTDPPDGYASMSIVDIGYLGIALDDPLTDAATRRRLLDAPLLPFDGMNEKGLVIGLAEDRSGRASIDPARPTVSGVRIIRLMLDRAATVDEALAVMARYNLDFTGSTPLHYLLADPSGASAVVEFVDGRMEVIRGGSPWQALTNIRLYGSSAAQRQEDRRYRTAAEALDASGGRADWSQAMELLADLAQGHTRWSVTYDMATGAVKVVTRKRWGTVHEFQVGLTR